MTSQPEKKPSGFFKIAKVIYLIIMIGYTAYSVIVAIQAYVKYKDIAGQFNNLIQNWRSDVILDIEGVAPTASCSTGFEPFLTYNWPGTVAGCDCRNIINTKPDPNQNITLEKKWYRSTCNSTQTMATCVTNAETPAMTVNHLFGSPLLNRKKFCVKKQKGDNFIKLGSKMKADGTCMSGYKLCGGKTNKMYGLCVPTSYAACPIMDIRTDPPDASVLTQYSIVPTSSNHLYVSKFADAEGAPMSEVFLNEEGICRASIGKSTASTNHPLMKTNIPSCSKFEDTFTRLGTYESGKYDLFLFNDVNLTITPTDISDYVKNTQLMRTFKRGFLPFKPNCREEVKKMEANDDEVKSMTGAQTALLAIAIIVGVFLGIIFTFLGICDILECGTEEQQQKRKKWLAIRKYLNFGIKFLHIAALVWAVAVSGAIKAYFNDLAVKKCSDDTTNKDLTNLSDQVNNFVYAKNRSSLIVTCLMIFLDILMLLYGCLCGKKDQQPPQNSQPAAAGQSQPQQAPIAGPGAGYADPNPYAQPSPEDQAAGPYPGQPLQFGAQAGAYPPQHAGGQPEPNVFVALGGQ